MASIQVYIVTEAFVNENDGKQRGVNTIDFNQTTDGRWFVNIDAARILPSVDWSQFEIVTLTDADFPPQESK